MLGGASLTTEKTYLLGKFARVCLKTPYIDYNGRLCMVSAGAANKKAFGIDRTTNPWADMVGTEVIWVAGSNVAECSPITTNYIWQAREQGAKIIIQDPRITPIARTCDLFLPVKPGRDAALFAGVLQIMIEHDWIDHAFIDAHTVGFDQVAEYCRQWTLARTADVTGVPERAILQAAEWWGTAKTSFLLHARGIEHHSNGVQNTLGTINLVLATGRIGKPKSGYGTIVGQAQRPGRPRARAEVRSAAGLARHQQSRAPQVHRRRLGHRRARPSRARRRRLRDVPQDRRRRDQGPASPSASIRRCRCPTTRSSRRCLEKLEFFVAIDFFLNDTARHADIVLPAACRKKTRAPSRRSRAASSRSTRRSIVPARRAQDWRIIQDIARALGRPHGFTFASPREIFEELRVASKGGVADYSGVTYEKIEQQTGRVLALLQRGSADRRAASIIPARRGCSSPAASTRSPKAPGRSTFPTAARASTSPTTARRSTTRRRVSDLSHHRPRREPVSVRHPDAAHRPAGEAVSRAAHRDAPAARGEARHRRWRLGDGRDAARRDHAPGAWS